MYFRILERPKGVQAGKRGDTRLSTITLTVSAVEDQFNQMVHSSVNEFVTKPILRHNLKQACERNLLKEETNNDNGNKGGGGDSEIDSLLSG